VGKSINIRKRIIQHFNIDYKSNKSIEFKNRIADITYELTGSELVALLYESDLIKKLQPLYNRQQRRSIFSSGIYLYEDQNGYKRFTFEKVNSQRSPLIALTNHHQSKSFLHHMVEKYNLCQKLSGLYKTNGACFDYQVHRCQGACLGLESPSAYNARVEAALESFRYEHESFVLIGKGRQENERTVVCVENNRYLGFGYIDDCFQAQTLQDFKEVIRPYQDNKDVQQIIRSYMRSGHKDKLIIFDR
jgi:DNA polymerase III subunit epsilon